MSSAITQLDLQKQSPLCRTYKLQNNPITVFDGTKKTSSNFAAQVATLKNDQDDCRPFYVMNADRVDELLGIWTKLLPRIQPFYSLKCNADPVLLRLLTVHPFVGFNCASTRETQTALDFVPQERILGSNPCWTGHGLRQAAEQCVQLLSFESDRDLDRILSNHPNADLLLHICVNPESEDTSALFGCPPDKAVELLQLAAEIGLRCVGVSFSVGADDCYVRPALFGQAIEWSARLFQVGAAFGHQMNVLNIGDGFASPLNEWQYAQFAELCAYINAQLDAHGFYGDKNVRLMATPGQFFAGSVYSLITNIIGKRTVDASCITNNDFDAGNEAFLYQTNDGYYGSFGCRIMTNCDPKCAPLFDEQQQQSFGTVPGNDVYGTVIGPMGFDDPETDVVQSICHFRQLHVGDWLYWADMGAYSMANRGSLDDDDEFGGDESSRSDSPTIFYFASRENWDRLSQELRGEQQFDDAESMGSCGETMVQTDMEEEEETGNGAMDGVRPVEEEEKAEDNFWMFGWPLHCE